MTLKKLLLALLASLIVAELALQLVIARGGGLLRGWPLPPFGAINHPQQRAALERLEGTREPVRGVNCFDRELGWTNLPRATSADGRFHTNSLGLRGTREYEPRPAEGMRRITCFGDSFTFGDEVPDADSYPARIEQQAQRVEALNFGVGGYGTDQALLRYRREGRGLGAQVVLVGLLLENIGRNVNRYRPLWNTRTGLVVPKPRFVLEPDAASPSGSSLRALPQPYLDEAELARDLRSGALLERLREHEHWCDRPKTPRTWLPAVARVPLAYWAYTERREDRLWQHPQDEPFRVTIEILDTFRREALADGALRCIVLVFPTKEDLRDYSERGVHYWGELGRELDRRGIEWIDTTHELYMHQAVIHREPQRGALYSGGHLSGEGNSVVARTVLERLERAAPPQVPVD